MLHLKRACFGLLLIEQGILHLRRATCGSWVIKRGIIHFQRDCFGIWFIKRGKLHLKRASCVFSPYRTWNVIFEGRVVYGLFNEE